MYSVYEVDYHDRAYLIGTASTIAEARKIARLALKRSGHAFPTFIDSGTEIVDDIR